MWHRVVFSGVLLTAVAMAPAGITINDAEARITFFGATAADPPNTRTRAVVLGDLDHLLYDGGIPGSPRGDGSVFYSVEPFKGGFQLYVQVRHETFDFPDGAGGNASFDLAFTSDVPLRFAFEANIVDPPPASFSAIIQPVEATAQFAGDNTWTGTFPQTTNDAGEVEFGLFSAAGVIPAGKTSFLSIDAITVQSTYGNPPRSEGFVRFNVEPLAHAIPLPPAAWPAAGCIGAWVVARIICGRDGRR